MAGPIAKQVSLSAAGASSAVRESPLVKWMLIALAGAFMGLFVLLPVANIFSHAFSKGVSGYVRAFYAPEPTKDLSVPREVRRQQSRDFKQAQETRDAIKMTLLMASIAVPTTALFGIAAAWAVARFRFPGRTALVALIELPFSVSPVVAGLVFVLLFGAQGWLGDWAPTWHWSYPTLFWRGFSEHFWPIAVAWNQQTGIIFTPLAMALATVFVTFPFVARTLMPLMESQGSDEELAAITLGASGWQMFRRVTLPKIKWGLLYGVILCNARAMGEFGAVSVVAGDLPSNNTLPLRIEAVYQQPGSFDTAFAVASVLTLLAVVTLVLKVVLERKG